MPPLSLPPKTIASHPQTARQDTLSSIANHVSSMNARINRLSAINQQMQSVLASETPEGMSRIDWLARRLNAS